MDGAVSAGAGAAVHDGQSPYDSGSDAGGPDQARAAWSVPNWVRHPRLEGILGARLADLSWNHLVDLVTRKVPEDLSIDFKQSHYVLDRELGRMLLRTADATTIDQRMAKDRAEFAKDITAFANAAGGLIVIGISDSNGSATGIPGVELKDKHRLTYLDTLRTWTAPYLLGIEIGHVADPTDPGRGCVVVYVPPSADRPHAVTAPNSHRYAWYMRDGGHVAALSEAQIAAAYRDRYAGRADIEQRIQDVFNQGVADLDRQDRVWLAAAVTPSKGAISRHLDRRLLEEFKAQSTLRQADLPGAALGHHASFGRGRVVLRDSPANVTQAADHLVHLYVDGSAFAAVALDKLEDTEAVRRGHPDMEWDVQCIRVGSITTWAITLAGVVAGHAVDSGASGDLELVCGIITATHEDPDILSPETLLPPLQHVVLDQPWRSSPHENIIAGSTYRNTLTPVQMTVSPVVATDMRELVTVGAQLVSDIVAEFGQLPSDPMLTADGLVVGAHCTGRHTWLRDWAHSHRLLTEDQDE